MKSPGFIKSPGYHYILLVEVILNFKQEVISIQTSKITRIGCE